MVLARINRARYVSAVKPFIDLTGASGAVYRFRRATGELSPIGGNFVYIREAEGGFNVVCCGKSRSIGWVITKRAWFSDDHAQPDDLLYIRLNAGATIRDREHQDLLEGLPRPFVIYEID